MIFLNNCTLIMIQLYSYLKNHSNLSESCLNLGGQKYLVTYSCCLGRLCYLSVPQFSCLYNQNNSTTPFIRWFQWLNEVIRVKLLVQHLAHRKCSINVNNKIIVAVVAVIITIMLPNENKTKQKFCHSGKVHIII